MGRFDSLTCFLEKFEGDEFGNWIFDREHKGTKDDPIHMPFPHYTDVVFEFIKAVHTFSDDYPEYNLKQYLDLMKKRGLRSINSVDIESLDIEGVLLLLMWVVRGERFCDGLILGGLKEGRIQALLYRLKELGESNEELQQNSQVKE